MKISILTPCIVFALSTIQISYAQDKSEIKFGKVAPADFILPASKVIDSNSNAVYIADIGKTTFKGNKKGWVDNVYTRSARIYVINGKGTDAATFHLYLYRNDDDEEILENLSAVTYNLENGQVTNTKLAKNEIFKEKRDKHHFEVKFTLPNVKAKSLIECTYTIRSDFNFNLQPWSFQTLQYPVLWSEYEVAIPGLLSYVFVRQGRGTFHIQKNWEGRENYIIDTKPDQNALVDRPQLLNVGVSTGNYRWVMKDEPALAISSVDKYIYAPRDHLDRVEFQLYQTNNGETTHDVMNTWKKTTDELLDEEEFGGQLNNGTEWIDEPLKTILNGSKDEISDAKAIYYYLSTNFTCTDYYDKYVRNPLKQVFKKRSGSVGELNMLLIAMLQRRNLRAIPVLLSTREFGTNNPKYPILDRINYVICKLDIGNTTYYLDAAQPALGFGRLAENCYNGHARKVSKTDSGSLYFNPDSLIEKKFTSVLLFNNEKDHLLTGSYQSIPGYLESHTVRSQMVGSGLSDYFKQIGTLYGSEFTLRNGTIDSLKNVEDPIKIKFDFDLRYAGEDFLYINPMLFAGYRENPFSAATRMLPVESRSAFDETYVFSMDIPEGYKVEEIPKSARVAYNVNEGMFEYLVEKDDTRVQLRMHIKMNKAWYAADEYNILREFYAYVVKKCSESLVMKKVK